MAEIAGLKLIVPSSVAATGSGSSASVSASGKITFTSAETLEIEDCFVGYDNYLCVFRGVVNSGDLNIFYRLRSSGSSATASDYNRQILQAISAGIFSNRATSKNVGHFGVSSGTDMSGFHTYFYGPSLAQPTASRAVCAWAEGGAAIREEACTHTLSTAYDGLEIYPETAGRTMTGGMTVYGLSQ